MGFCDGRVRRRGSGGGWLVKFDGDGNGNGNGNGNGDGDGDGGEVRGWVDNEKEEKEKKVWSDYIWVVCIGFDSAAG